MNYQFNFPDWSELDKSDVTGLFWENQEFEHLNRTIVATVLKLKEVNNEIMKYDRLKLLAESKYKQKFRENILKATGKTETQKKIQVEILCEEEESEVIYYEELSRELNRIANTLRTELDTLKTLGFNLRQELRV